MSATSSAAAKRKLRPARKQVKPGEIDKSEGPQPGKEYSGSSHSSIGAWPLCHKAARKLCGSELTLVDVWYNKWAGGDKEDALAKWVF